MNLGKLPKRLKKELAANPKQAAVLGVACLAALWFYAPMVTTWIKGTPAKPKSLNTPLASENQPAIPSTLANAKPANWMEVHAWRLADGLTQPASLALEACDPFAKPKKPEPSEIVEAAPEAVKKTSPVEMDPAELGLVLKAVSIGPKRFAQISGQTVQENDTLTLPREEGEPLRALVASISPAEVVLKIGNQSLRLKLASKSLSPGEVVVGVGSRN